LSATAYANSPNTLRQVDFYASGQSAPIAKLKSAPYQTTWTNVPPGSYSLSAVATDSQGQQGSAAAPSIRVWHTPQVALTAPAAGSTLPTGVPVSLVASIIDPDHIGVSPVNFYSGAQWIAGASAPSSPNTFTASYSFAQTGNVNLLAVAYNNLGTRTTSATLNLRVGAGGTPPPANSGPFAYITNSAEASVSILDTASDTVLGTVPVGAAPQAVAIAPDASRVYIGNHEAGTISVLDPALPGVVALVPLPSHPQALIVSPDGTRLYASGAAGKVVEVIDTASQTRLGSLTVGNDPQGLALSPEGARLYVANRADASVSVLDTASSATLATWPLPTNSEPLALAVNAAGTRLYASAYAAHALYVLDTGSGQLLATFDLAPRPWGLALTPNQSLAVVAHHAGPGSGALSLVNLATGTVRRVALPASANPLGLSVHPDGSRAYVASPADGQVYVLDLVTAEVIRTVAVGSGPYGLGSFIAWPQPTLSLTSPAANALVNTATPRLDFAYGTRCLDFLCQLGPNYYSGGELLLTLNGAAPAGSVSFGPGTVSWQATSALGDGPITLAAQLQDRFGRRSNPVTSSFIDPAVMYLNKLTSSPYWEDGNDRHEIAVARSAA
jgi:YVTN family beta-propeller protein